MTSKFSNLRASSNQVTQSEYDYLKSQAEAAEEKVMKLQEELQLVAQDGTDDENPAFAQVKASLAAATSEWNKLKETVSSAVIVKPTQVEEGQINEAVKSVKLRCTYAPDDIVDKVFIIGHELGNVTPSSPMFKFLMGKSVGYKGTFTFKPNRDNTVSYDIEILDITF